MSDRDQASRAMLGGLLAGSHLMAWDQLPRRVAEQASLAGLDDVMIYLCDLQQNELRLLSGQQELDSESAHYPVDGSLPGRAFQYGKIVAQGDLEGGGRRWWVPLLDGTGRLGVLRMDSRTDDERTRQDMLQLAAAVALLVVSKRVSSDAHARLVRARRMNVAAEMEWHLTPPLAYADERVVVAAAMEPAYEVSGDAFDYATAAEVVHLGLFDAMGHNTAAGLAANLAMATCRNLRRQGAGLVEISEGVERVLIEQFERRMYVTAVLANLDTLTGQLTWINRGHLPPVLIRAGRWTTQLQCSPGHPMGTDLGLETHLCHEQLEPGDRLVLYTDGITEARRPGGPEFGLARFTDFLIRHHADGLPVPETLRRLVGSILTHHHGHLNDDATVLLLEWHGPTPYPAERVRELVGLPTTVPHPDAP